MARHALDAQQRVLGPEHLRYIARPERSQQTGLLKSGSIGEAAGHRSAGTGSVAACAALEHSARARPR